MSEFDRESREPDYGEGGVPEQGSAAPVGRVPRSSAPARPRVAQANDGEDTLHQYIRSIGSIPVLSREQTYDLARAMEAEAFLVSQDVLEWSARRTRFDLRFLRTSRPWTCRVRL